MLDGTRHEGGEVLAFDAAGPAPSRRSEVFQFSRASRLPVGIDELALAPDQEEELRVLVADALELREEPAVSCTVSPASETQSCSLYRHAHRKVCPITIPVW